MRLRAFLRCAAALATAVALATFLGTDYFAYRQVSATGLQLSPQYSGGEIVRIIEHGKYKTLQHRAVFGGLVGPKAEGFVQLDYAPLNALPEIVIDDIDFDLDGTADFRLEYNVTANSAVLTPYNSRVISLEGCYTLRERRAVRVILLNR